MSESGWVLLMVPTVRVTCASPVALRGWGLRGGATCETEDHYGDARTRR